MADEKKDDIYDEEDFEEEDDDEEDRVGLFTKIKEALNPRKIIKYILSNLWKPVLVSILLLSFSLASVYAAAYYKLLNAKSTLDFEPSMVQIRESENPVIKYTLPLIEWSSATLSAAGEIMQTRIDQIEKDREALQQEEEKKNQENSAADVKDGKKGEGNSPDSKTAPDNKESQRPSQEELKRQREEEAELKRLADERLQELNKRASRLAAYYSSMPPKDAVEILKKMDDDEVIVIMNRMENDVASQILAGLEPERASAISKKILKLQPAPLILSDGDAKDVL